MLIRQSINRQRPYPPFVLNRNTWQAQRLEAWVPCTLGYTVREMIRGATLQMQATIGTILPAEVRPFVGGAFQNFSDGVMPAAGAAQTIPHNDVYNMAQYTVTAVAMSEDAAMNARTIWARSPQAFVNGIWCLGAGTTNGTLRFSVFDNASQKNAQTTQTWPQSQVLWLVGTNDGSTITLWVNGVNQASSACVAAASITQGLTLGARSDGSPWRGTIFDCRLYSYAWKSEQVAAWMASPWDIYWQRERTYVIGPAVAAGALRPRGLMSGGLMVPQRAGVAHGGRL